jgi:hydroxymethylpyrimidine/phosphomethylpyrimidine kinase
VTPRVLLLGGLDPSGGAGITADATVVALHHAHPLPIVVAFTEQNRASFRRLLPVPTEQWGRALQTVLEVEPVAAIKVGMLADAVSVRGVARELARFRGHVPIVVDPVLSATAGGLTAGPELLQAYVELLLPLATLLTPNGPELAALSGVDPERALADVTGAVLAKGGHGDGAACEDVLWRGKERVAFRRERLACGPVRGTGCALAAAIAARLARGEALASACRHAGDWLAALLRALGAPPGDGLPRVLPFARVQPLLGEPR